MGTDSSSKRKDIRTIVSLGLKVEGAEEDAPKPEAICVELSPEELQKLYDTLEKVQGQLDALTDKK